jgi:hypothetical protein
MARARVRTPQQREARELALSRPPDPYRGGLSDPFSPVVIAPATPAPRIPPDWRPATRPDPGPAQAPATGQHRDLTRRPAGTPRSATFAGVLGIALGLTLGLFGLLLLTIVTVQSNAGAPDRSFYRGTDSGYVILALLDFGLAGCCVVGAIMMLAGRVAGRIAVTAGGWACLVLSGFWSVRGDMNKLVPVVLAVAAAVMLFFAYQRVVTDWLGVLPPPQPEDR